MTAEEITLCNFRNIEAATVRFHEGVNVLYGDNAQGKTNLLEAVYYAAIGKSFRGQKAPEIIRIGAEYGSLSLDFTGSGRKQNMTVRLFRDRQRAVEINRVRVIKMSEMVGVFRAVLFCPEHLALIKEGPAERRAFLNIAVSSLDPVYLASLQRYEDVLKQRNALLKKAETDRAQFDDTVDIWSRQLAKESSYIARARKRYVERADVFVKRCFAEMTGSAETPQLKYKGLAKEPDHDYEDLAATEKACYKLLCAAHEREIGAGATLWGVHKDDIEVTLNGLDARLYASQGQQRSLSLAMKIAEGEIVREDCGEYPVFLFDDVLSELDAKRRAYLLSEIANKQVIITACEYMGDLPAHRILVQNGRYTKTQAPQSGA